MVWYLVVFLPLKVFRKHELSRAGSKTDLEEEREGGREGGREGRREEEGGRTSWNPHI